MSARTPSSRDQIHLPALPFDANSLVLAKDTRDLAQRLQDPEGFRQICVAALAPNTRQTYAYRLRPFYRWCAANERCPVPATLETLLDYFNAKAHDGRALKTLEVDLVAIRYLHKAAGYPTPYDPAINDFFRGARKLLPPPNKLDPFSDAQLALLSDLLDQYPNQDLAARDRALILLDAANGERRSEITATLIPEVRFVMQGMEIWLPRSKTDQTGLGRSIGIPFHHDPDLDPVRAVRQWYDRLGRDRGPLFPAFQNGKPTWRALSPQQYYAIVTNLASVFADGKHYAPHSFRARVVTQHLDAGEGHEQISRITGQRSEKTILEYDRFTDPWATPSYTEAFFQ